MEFSSLKQSASVTQFFRIKPYSRFFSDTLYREGEGAKETMDLEDALHSFLDWLSEIGGRYLVYTYEYIDPRRHMRFYER